MKRTEFVLKLKNSFITGYAAFAEINILMIMVALGFGHFVRALPESPALILQSKTQDKRWRNYDKLQK